jgi:hypothetical protein
MPGEGLEDLGAGMSQSAIANGRTKGVHSHAPLYWFIELLELGRGVLLEAKSREHVEGAECRRRRRTEEGEKGKRRNRREKIAECLVVRSARSRMPRALAPRGSATAVGVYARS